MPLSKEQFVGSRLCKDLVLPDEEQPQDERDWKRMVREDQDRQYGKYLSQFEPEENQEEPLHNALHNTKSALRKGNEKWNEYMRNYNKRPVKCPKCGHEFRKLKRV